MDPLFFVRPSRIDHFIFMVVYWMMMKNVPQRERSTYLGIVRLSYRNRSLLLKHGSLYNLLVCRLILLQGEHLITDRFHLPLLRAIQCRRNIFLTHAPQSFKLTLGVNRSFGTRFMPLTFHHPINEKLAILTPCGEIPLGVFWRYPDKTHPMLDLQAVVPFFRFRKMERFEVVCIHSKFPLIAAVTRKKKKLYFWSFDEEGNIKRIIRKDCINFSSPVSHICFHPDLPIFICTEQSMIYVFFLSSNCSKIVDRKMVSTHGRHNITCLACHGRFPFIITGDTGHNAILWDLREMIQLVSFPTLGRKGICSVALHQHLGLAAIGFNKGIIHLWTIDGDGIISPFFTVKNVGDFRHLSFHPHSPIIVTSGNSDGSIRILLLCRENVTCILKLSDESSVLAVFDPTGSFLAICGTYVKLLR
jgi:hypothetical protein